MNGGCKSRQRSLSGQAVSILSLEGSLKISVFCFHLGLSLILFIPESGAGWLEKHYLQVSHTKQEDRLINLTLIICYGVRLAH